MKSHVSLVDLLESFRSGDITLEEAASKIERSGIEFVEGIARIDSGRALRCGIPEVVLAEGKESGQLAKIMNHLLASSGRCIATRISEAQVSAVIDAIEQEHVVSEYRDAARALILSDGTEVPRTGGKVAILTAGTADIGVAEEARLIAEEMGCEVITAYDVGIAGIHRLFPAIKDMLDAHVFIVAAGREGTLPAIVAGLVDRPVIGVPVSTGYGYMGRGEAALASMLQSCSVLTVVNIDAGFVAGAFAARIAQMVAEK